MNKLIKLLFVFTLSLSVYVWAATTVYPSSDNYWYKLAGAKVSYNQSDPIYIQTRIPTNYGYEQESYWYFDLTGAPVSVGQANLSVYVSILYPAGSPYNVSLFYCDQNTDTVNYIKQGNVNSTKIGRAHV